MVVQTADTDLFVAALASGRRMNAWRMGERRFRYRRDERGLACESTYCELLQRHTGQRLKGPLTPTARLQAGYTEEQLAALAG